jgi:hypothetical protein
MSNQHEWINELVERLGFWRSDKWPWRSPTAEEIARLEAKIGGNLPDDYRHFVSNYGGGMLSSEDYTIKVAVAEPCPWGELVRPEQLYALLPGHGYDLGEQLDSYRGRIPNGVLPIADDPGGNQTCLDIAGAFPGTVWFWDHEQRWFKRDLEQASRELVAKGADGPRLSVHDIIRGWARLHADELDRPPDYMGMYRIAPTFADFLHGLRQLAE